MRIIIQDTKHLKLKQDLLWVGTATLVTVIIWVAYAVYTAFNQTTIDTSVAKLLIPLNPSLDQTALSKLDDRFVPPEDFTVLVVSSDGTDRQVAPLGLSPVEIEAGSASAASIPTPTPLDTTTTDENLF